MGPRGERSGMPGQEGAGESVTTLPMTGVSTANSPALLTWVPVEMVKKRPPHRAVMAQSYTAQKRRTWGSNPIGLFPNLSLQFLPPATAP